MLGKKATAVLEKEKPNSRPETIVLPKPRDTESPKVGSTKVLDEELRSTEDEDILKESSEKEKSEKASDKTSGKASDKTTEPSCGSAVYDRALLLAPPALTTSS